MTTDIGGDLYWLIYNTLGKKKKSMFLVHAVPDE